MPHKASLFIYCVSYRVISYVIKMKIEFVPVLVSLSFEEIIKTLLDSLFPHLSFSAFKKVNLHIILQETF